MRLGIENCELGIGKKRKFINAQEEYGEEESAFRVAWSAVKRDYEKGSDGHWHKKSA